MTEHSNTPEQVTSTTALSSSATERLPDHIVVERDVAGVTVLSRKRRWPNVVAVGAIVVGLDVIAVLALTISRPLWWPTVLAVVVTAVALQALRPTAIEVSQRRMRTRGALWSPRVDVAVDDVTGVIVSPTGTGRRAGLGLWLVRGDGAPVVLMHVVNRQHGEDVASTLRRLLAEAGRP